MNYQDWRQKLRSVHDLLGMVPVAGERQVGVMGQVFYLLTQMEDECTACIQQQSTAEAEPQ